MSGISFNAPQHPNEADRACMSFQKVVMLGKNRIKAQMYSNDDISLSLRLASASSPNDPAPAPGDIQAAIEAELVRLEGVQGISEPKYLSNISAVLAFSSLNQVNQLDFNRISLFIMKKY